LVAGAFAGMAGLRYPSARGKQVFTRPRTPNHNPFAELTAGPQLAPKHQEGQDMHETITCPTDALRLERLEREPIFASSPEMYSTVSAENEAAGQKRPLA